MDNDFVDDFGFDADNLERILTALDNLNISAERVSRTLTRSFANAVVSGKSFEAVLKNIAQTFVSMSLSAGLRPLQTGISSLIGSTLSSVGGGGPLNITPFADGGVVSRPTFFGSQGGSGLWESRGPKR